MIDIDAMLAEAVEARPRDDLDAVQESVMGRLSAPERPLAGRRPLLAFALCAALGGGAIGGWTVRPSADALPRTIDADARYAPSVLLGRTL
ncbi:MAG: hypothetical protein ACRYG4_28145 [Janthinobacterium lividum]